MKIFKSLYFTKKYSKYMFFISLILFLMVFIESASFYFTYSTLSKIIVIAQLSSTLLTGITPTFGSWIVAIVWLISAYSVQNYASTFYFTLWFSISSASYRHTINGIAISVILSISTLFINNQFSLDSIKRSIIDFGVYLSLTIIGYSIRKWQDTKNEKIKLKRKLQNDKIASILHDGICNDLSFLLLSMGDNEEFLRLPDSNKYLTIINNILQRTRTIISTLEYQDSSDSSMHNKSGIKDLIDRYRETLQDEGFKGEVFYKEIDELYISKENKELITHIIQELFGNIVKYADKKHEYYMSISFTPNKVTISEANTPSFHVEKQTMHTGLERLNKKIMLQGGTFKINASSQQWFITITLPFKNTHTH